MTHCKRIAVLGLLIVLTFCATPRAAHAGIILITRGDSFIDLGEINRSALPDELKESIGKLPGDVRVGYKYSYVGIFWVNFWTYGGEYCVYKDMTYDSLKPEEAATLLHCKQSELSVPLRYRFPTGWWLLLGGGVFFLVGAVLGNKQTATHGDDGLDHASPPGSGEAFSAPPMAGVASPSAPGWSPSAPPESGAAPGWSPPPPGSGPPPPPSH